MYPITKVAGQVPSTLRRGVLFHSAPRRRGCEHAFDGDGEVHAVDFRSMTYGSHVVQTYRLETERTWGPVFPRLSAMCSPLHWALQRVGVIDKSKGAGTANTSIVHHADRLFALHEGDFPYELAYDDTLTTVGRYDFGGRLKHNVGAHPKFDNNGDMVVLGYGFQPPYCAVSFVGPDGLLYRTIDVHLERPVIMHDFGLTPSYIVVLDFPLTVGLDGLQFVPSRGARIGLVRRDTGQARWFHTDPTVAFHVAHVAESDDAVTLHAFCYQDFDFWNMSPPRLQRFRLDLRRGTCTRALATATPGEFPVAHGKDVYFASAGFGELNGIVKYDTRSGVQTRLAFPAGLTGGEALYVDGHLAVFVADPATATTELHVYDAATMDPTPTCRLLVGNFSPGLHSKFVSYTS